MPPAAFLTVLISGHDVARAERLIVIGTHETTLLDKHLLVAWWSSVWTEPETPTSVSAM